MKHKKIFLLLIFSLGISYSCKKFVETEPPKNSLVPEAVFKSDDLVSAAILGIYQRMAASGSASGNQNSISTICGLTADEFIGYSAALQPVYQNQIIAENSSVSAIWGLNYQIIYNANAIIEGLIANNSITPAVKNQVLGEALFIRAFNYFYLVNLFGSIPLQVSTAYKLNSRATRADIATIYAQIVKDLKVAESLLVDNYVSTERVRPNKSAVYALLARVYLYTGEWENAEYYASKVIEKNTMYRLTAIDQIFLKNSLETIWQLMPPAGSNSPAGSFLILTTVPTLVSLNPSFAQLFEDNDQRRISWIRTYAGNGVIYHYPFKYKVKSSTTISEYTMVFRLAEQFLIRAEARTQQNNLLGAIADIDQIRNRAGITLIKNTNSGISQLSLLNAIQKERRVELFGEWGDRWFDLKRTQKLTTELQSTKPNWKPVYELFPIPQTEINFNPLITQNNGY